VKLIWKKATNRFEKVSLGPWGGCGSLLKTQPPIMDIIPKNQKLKIVGFAKMASKLFVLFLLCMYACTIMSRTLYSPKNTGAKKSNRAEIAGRIRGGKIHSKAVITGPPAKERKVGDAPHRIKKNRRLRSSCRIVCSDSDSDSVSNSRQSRQSSINSNSNSRKTGRRVRFEGLPLIRKASLQPNVRGRIQTPKVVHLPASMRHVRELFSEFRFKGLGLTLQKPLKSWGSAGFGVRIPLTANFPGYDRVHSLPRLSMTLVGYYPFDMKVSIAASFPANQALYAASLVTKKAGLSSQELTDRIIGIKASDSIKRVGFTVGMYYTQERGVRYSVGPYGIYMPGRRIMAKLMPILVAVPAFIPGIFMLLADYARALLTNSEEVEAVPVLTPPSSVPPSATQAVSPPSLPSPSSKLSSERAAAVAEAGGTSASISSTSSAAGLGLGLGRGLGVVRLLGLVSSKSTVGIDLAKTIFLGTKINLSKRTLEPASMGSTIEMNISPFFLPVAVADAAEGDGTAVFDVDTGSRTG